MGSRGKLRDHRVGQRRVELGGRIERGRAVAAHLRRDQHEVDVVRVVGRLVHRVRRRGLEVLLVDGHCALVDLQRFPVLADAVVDVGRHVHDMTRTGHQRSQPSRVRQRALGLRRRLDRVNVEVYRSRVIWIACEHLLQCREQLGGAALRFRSPRFPVIPGLRVHHGLGVEREDRVVARILLGHRLHRVSEVRVEPARSAFGSAE